MTSLGRGRGILPSERRSVTATVPDPHLSNNSLKSLVGQIPSALSPRTVQAEKEVEINLDFFEEKLKIVKEDECLLPFILNILNDPLCTASTVKKLINIIFERSKWCSKISGKYAALFSLLTSHKVYGKDIKYLTFSALENLYNNRDSIWKCGDGTFRNGVILTGEIYYRWRIHNTRLQILCEPMLTYLKTLSNSSNESDLITLTQQISWNASEIAMVNRDGMDELMLHIRHLLVNSSAYTEKVKFLFLLCFELNFQPFHDLPVNVKKFYSDVFGKETFESLEPPSLKSYEELNPEYYNTICEYFS